MANSYHGRVNIVGELSDAQTLPNAGAVDSTNMVYIGDPTLGNLYVDIYANTAISIASGQAFTIELQGYSSDTAASATSLFSTGNAPCIEGASGTLEDNAHTYILYKSSSDAQLDFAAGDLIMQFGIPEDMFRLLGYDYMQLVYTTDADESSEKVDAFVYSKS